MAEKKDPGIQGYDPLAWMNNDTGPVENTAGQHDGQALSAQMENGPLEHQADATIDETGPDAADNAQSELTNLTLDEVMNIQGVTALYEKLRKIFDEYPQIDIDASNVQSIDTASLQLLIIIKQEAIKLHKQLVFDFPSEAFIEAAKLLGLDEMLEIDSPGAGFF